MNKFLALNVLCVGTLSACNSGGTATSTPTSCPANAPLFTESVAAEIINTWGDNALAYSSYGTATSCISNGVSYDCQDPYVGAAFFTGIGYVSDAVLLPTVSPVTRVGYQQIYDYFTSFLATGPVMTLVQPLYVTTADCGYGVVSGYYDFSFSDSSPSADARYTFQFQYMAESQNATIMVESGSESGTTMYISSGPGWYIGLQNSAVLPSLF